MYEAYFRLLKRPFSATPDANCLYASESLRTLLVEVVERASSGQGICVLTGAAGTGKTLLCRKLLLEFGSRFTPLFLANANYSTRRELLQAVHFELGRRCTGLEEQESRQELVSSLRGLIVSGKPAILVVDEAHLLNERLLEELRTLANLSEGDQPLLRVILVGQMALEMRLVDPALEALNQRIVCQTYLDPLTRQESREYVEYRVRWADGLPETLFEPTALDLIAEVCNGLPRCLNQLCDHSLLLAFVQEAPSVSRGIAEQALADLRQLPLHWNESAAAGPLADDAATDDDLFVLDDTELEPIDDDELTDPSRILEPTAAFEIGADETDCVVDEWCETSPEHVGTGAADASSPWVAIEPSADAPRSTDSAGVRVFRDEPVDDRYAALDRLAPRISRTFEETDLAEGWRPAPQATTSSSAAAATPPHEAVTDAPLEVAPGPSEPASPVLADDSDDLVPTRIHSSIDDSSELEEELGNSVLDVCLELQESIGQWWEPQSIETTPDYRPEGLDHDSLSREAQYDIVEPEEGEESRDVTDRIDRPAGGRSRSGRIVPQPNYRHVFSALRRKLGRCSRG